MEELNKEIRLAMTADLQRATDFLKGAREIEQEAKNKEEYLEKDKQLLTKEKSIDLVRGRVVQRQPYFMALKHGNKTYMQILLDPHRARLVMEQAKSENIRATAWIRNAVYRELERDLPASTYKEAEAKDEAVWRESVRRRVEGRNTNGESNDQDESTGGVP